jgi:hypothetical protein
MEEKTKIEELTDQLKTYIDTRYDLVVLSTAEKASIVGSQAVAYLAIGISAVLFIVFLSIALGLYFSSLFGSSTLGFLVVAGIYLLIGTSFILFKKQFSMPFRNKIIRSVLSENN